jgi:UDP-glucose 4-epimerase
MANWLVTGGCGFIGSHLVDALVARGDRVRVLDDLSSGKRENLAEAAELVVGDVADRHITARAAEGADGIFHLAAVASVERCAQDWVESHRTNLTGTITIFDEARRGKPKPVPVVYASSAAVYGDSDRLPLSETEYPRPLSAYGADKLGGELHAQVAWSLFGVPNVGLRFFNVYGPRQDPSSPYSGVIAIFANRVAHHREIEIFGDGHQTRDFIFVGDVVAHLLAAMADLRSGARIYNVCTGQGISVLEMARAVAQLAGREPEIRYTGARRGDIKASVGDPTAARTAFGIVAAANLLDGLKITLDHMSGARLPREGR